MITKKELEKFDKAGYFKIRVLPKKITNQFYDEFAKSIASLTSISASCIVFPASFAITAMV